MLALSGPATKFGRETGRIGVLIGPFGSENVLGAARGVLKDHKSQKGDSSGDTVEC